MQALSKLLTALTERNYKLIRESLPSVKLVQVIHVIDESSVDEAIELSKKQTLYCSTVVIQNLP
jgi:hypothetical protein